MARGTCETALDAVVRAAQRYDITMLPTESMISHPSLPGFRLGPQGDAGFSLPTQTVCYAVDTDVEIVLHEMVHLILGKPGLRADEVYVLMPFEWILAKTIARWCSREQGRRLLSDVRTYQDQTTIGDGFVELRAFDNVRRTRYWQDGVRRAQHIGLLDEKRRVTWRFPRDDRSAQIQWPKSWEPPDHMWWT